MVQKIKDVISFLFRKFKIKNDNPPFIKTIEVSFKSEDFREGIPMSNECAIFYAFKRCGYFVKCTSSYVQMESGRKYYPENLSDHWEAYMGSEKNKPKTIIYKNRK